MQKQKKTSQRQKATTLNKSAYKIYLFTRNKKQGKTQFARTVEDVGLDVSRIFPRFMVEEKHIVYFPLRQEIHVISWSDPNIAIKTRQFIVLFIVVISFIKVSQCTVNRLCADLWCSESWESCIALNDVILIRLWLTVRSPVGCCRHFSKLFIAALIFLLLPPSINIIQCQNYQ